MVPPETGKDIVIELIMAAIFMMWPFLSYVLFGFTITQIIGGSFVIFCGFSCIRGRDSWCWLSYVYLAFVIAGIGMVVFGANAP